MMTMYIDLKLESLLFSSKLDLGIEAWCSADPTASNGEVEHARVCIGQFAFLTAARHKHVNSFSALLLLKRYGVHTTHSAPLLRGVRKLREIEGAENEHTEGARKGYFVLDEKSVD
jgi:hypothetical protein